MLNTLNLYVGDILLVICNSNIVFCLNMKDEITKREKRAKPF